MYKSMAPLSSSFKSFSALPLPMASATCGCRSRNIRAASVRGQPENKEKHPMTRLPCSPRATAARSPSALRNSLRSKRKCLHAASPKRVHVMPFPDRSYSLPPNISSISVRLLETVDCVECSCWAALERLPESAIAKTVSRCRSFVSVRQSHLDRLHDAVVAPQMAGDQRCGSSSSIRLAGWVGKRSSTSLRYA